MPHRDLPVYPDLDQLKHQAKDMLRALHAEQNGDPDEIALFKEFHPNPPEPAKAKLADAQLALARAYYAESWTRLVQAVTLAHAIWDDDIETVRTLVTKNPKLIHEHALIRPNSNWGPPLSYAANVGRDEIIKMLHSLGATDLEHAFGRAALQGKISTGKLLHEMLDRPTPPNDSLGGPAYTLNAPGTAFLFEVGVKAVDENGKRLAPVDVVLQSDSRRPPSKHAILKMYEDHGLVYPDTPTMALHRGRIDLLEKHLSKDPQMVNRTFTHREIYPSEMGCGDPINAVMGTPLGGTTLLQMSVDYEEIEIARWLIEHGADVNVRSTIDENGFGGYTALFSTVVGQQNFWMNYSGKGPFEAPFAELLLEHGADPNVRASVLKLFGKGYEDSGRYEFHDVTPLGYGRQYPERHRVFVSEPAVRLIKAAGGTE